MFKRIQFNELKSRLSEPPKQDPSCIRTKASMQKYANDICDLHHTQKTENRVGRETLMNLLDFFV